MATQSRLSNSPGENRVLVLGHSGRVGQLVVPALREFSPTTDWVLVDRDADQIPASARAIIALWGVTGGDPGALSMNSELAKKAQEMAEVVGARIVCHMSSIAVYDPRCANPDESADTTGDVVNAYAQSKVDMENVLREGRGAPRPIVMRLGNVVGADSLAKALTSGRATITRFPDGSGPLRSMIAPGDLAQIICRVLDLTPDQCPAVLNVASPQPVDMRELAIAAGCSVTDRDPTPTDRRSARMNTALLNALFPDVRLCQSAEQMIADWRKWSAGT